MLCNSKMQHSRHTLSMKQLRGTCTECVASAAGTVPLRPDSATPSVYSHHMHASQHSGSGALGSIPPSNRISATRRARSMVVRGSTDVIVANACGAQSSKHMRGHATCLHFEAHVTFQRFCVWWRFTFSRLKQAVREIAYVVEQVRFPRTTPNSHNPKVCVFLPMLTTGKFALHASTI